MPTPYTSTVLRNDYIPTHPGKSGAGIAQHSGSIIPFAEGEFGGFPSGYLAGVTSHLVLGSYTNGDYGHTDNNTHTTDSSSTIAVAGKGLVLTSSGNANEDTGITGLRTIVAATGQLYLFTTTLQQADPANTGLAAGFVTSTAVDPLGTEPTDCVRFASAVNAATVVGRMVENGNAATDTATLSTMANATDTRLTLKFYLGTTAAASWGEFWVDGTRTPMTAAQLADLFDMVNVTAPTLTFIVNQRASAAKTTTIRNYFAAVIPGLTDGFAATIDR